jgi:RHS repeat-associated protein
VVEEAGTRDNALRLPGQYHDQETGLHYNYFRDYDLGTGRYMESDPIGLFGGVNTYAYAANQPVTMLDPKGLIPVCVEMYKGPWRKKREVTKDPYKDEEFLGFMTKVAPTGTGVSPQGPIPGEPPPLVLCPSAKAMVKVYKVFKVIYGWDLYYRYERVVHHRCEDWGPYECAADGPFVSKPKTSEEEDIFVRPVSGERRDERFWFGFEMGVDFCPPIFRRQR